MEQFSTYNAFAKTGSQAAWLYEPILQKLLACLTQDGEDARIVGGAVRDTLLGRPVEDIDIAATALPPEVMKRARAAGFRCVPMGIEFGTVLAVAHGRCFQITTLRTDAQTDGRHAKVRFCRDWRLDAARRDFTVNALYVDKAGQLYDYAGGLADIKQGALRFIGDPAARIQEDYLRILRFFRFYALLAHGRPDAAAIKAIAALKDGVRRLSAERVWGELKKLLAAPDPFRSLLWMRTSGVLELILPESAKWGIDALPGLLQNERLRESAGGGDALLRLEMLIPPQAERVRELAKRLSLSRREKRRLLDWAKTEPIAADISEAALKKRLYSAVRSLKTGKAAEQGSQEEQANAVLDRLQTAYANARIYGKEQDCRRYAHLLRAAQAWQPPVFPLSGGDMGALGLEGRAVGKALKKLETMWIDSGFTLDKQSLLAKL